MALTNEQVAAGLLLAGYWFDERSNNPQTLDNLKRRILTCKGTEDEPTGGCGVGCSDVGTAWNTISDWLCGQGPDTPQDWEEIGNIVLTKGDRTDSLNY